MSQAGFLGILLGGKIKEARVFPEGQSSVVFLVETEKYNGPFVVKMTRVPIMVEAEADFLKSWAKVEVKTPEVLTIHSASKELPVSLAVLEYVQAPILSKVTTAEERVASGVARKLGVMQARMHQVKGVGFGSPPAADLKRGRYDTFSEEMENTLFGERVAWLKSEGIIDEQDIEIARKALAIMEADLASGTKASLTHNDFKPYNILATKPELTVIDCDPRITHPAMCLASTLLRTLTRDESFQKEEAEQILEGYRSITLISDQVLSAAMVLRSMKTLHAWQRKGKKERVVKLTSLMKEHQEKIVS